MEFERTLSIKKGNHERSLENIFSSLFWQIFQGQEYSSFSIHGHAVLMEINGGSMLSMIVTHY